MASHYSQATDKGPGPVPARDPRFLRFICFFLVFVAFPYVCPRISESDVLTRCSYDSSLTVGFPTFFLVCLPRNLGSDVLKRRSHDIRLTVLCSTSVCVICHETSYRCFL